MSGIDMNKPVIYLHSSMRYFKDGERHMTRTNPDEVLLLVYDGVLRFSEDGVEYEVHPGTFHIQKKNTYQSGPQISDSPQYLYVHFLAEWTEDKVNTIPKRGEFDVQAMMPLMVELDRLAHSGCTVMERASKFLELLTCLYKGNAAVTSAGKIAEYIDKNYLHRLTLDNIAEEFHFSKNHIINLFKEEYGMTPFEYINNLRIKKAEWLLEATVKASQEIASECGYNNYSHFYKSFYSVNGVSPTEWRENKRMKPSAYMRGR